MELISGQTVIARITAREGAESFPVDIVYMSETEGRINMPDGSTKIISGARYQKFLENYHEKMKLEEREKQLSRIIPPSEAENDDITFFDEEEGDYGYDIFDDENAMYEDEDTEEERMPVVAKQRQVPDRRFETNKTKKKRKVTKAYPEEETGRKKPISKTARIAIIAVVAVALLAGGLFLARALMKKGDSPASSMTVAVLKTDLAQGTALTEEMIESRKLSEEDYEILSNTTFVSPDGKTYTGTLVSWEDRASLIGGVALRTIEAGNAIMAEDLAKKESDGTVTEPAQPMQMRVVAIISSDQLKEDVMVELGKYVFEAGQLKDILDEANESLIPESETTTAEAESK